jgi:hypothetical protein
MRDLYTPNHIPQNERVTNILVSIGLVLYGGYGIWVNDLYIPGKRSRGYSSSRCSRMGYVRRFHLRLSGYAISGCRPLR